ncbi:MAG: hypothetical protein ACUVT5_04235 [Candidatus Bathyarchaeales archaeon]
MFSNKKPKVKRTTIILGEEERKFIDSLIQDGKEQGLKPLISKMLDVYRSMTIYDWKYPGEYYCGISRIAFINIEFINILLKHVPEEKWREVGKEAGVAAKVSMEASLNIEPVMRERWADVFKRLRVQGFGDFYLRDKYIILKAPFINASDFLCGYLEGLLGVRLEPRTSTAPFVFELVE